jgi:serine/threonine protein kinase
MTVPSQHDRPVNINRIMQLQLDTDLMDDDDVHHGLEQQHGTAIDLVTTSSSSSSSSCAFREDGISIGFNYLRINGNTYTRDELQTKNIKVHEIIGHGAFSTVYRATWYPSSKDGMDNHSNNICSSDKSNTNVQHGHEVEVAIKIWSLRDLGSYQRQNMLLQEIRTLSSSVSCQTKTLVQLYGAFLNTSPASSITMVLEYMNRGSLDDFIHRPQDVGATVHVNGLSEYIVAAILYQILGGLSVLHEHRIIHRDLKPANILLNANGYVKLCDFGIATASWKMKEEDVNNDQTLLNRTVLGTTKFMSPERLRAQPYGRLSDMWSFGCIVYQCLTSQCLWYDIASIVELLVTIEEMTISDLFIQIKKARYNNTHSCNRGQQANDSSDSLSTGVQEILSGCLQIDPGNKKSL